MSDPIGYNGSYVQSYDEFMGRAYGEPKIERPAVTFEPLPGVKVIGFGHRARHGKDTAAAAIVNGVPRAKRFSFADDLYAYCRVVHGMTTKDAPLLQRVGVEMRDRDPNVWVKAVYAKMLQEKPRLAVITDVRFPNEMAFIKQLGGLAVKVMRLNVDGSLFIDPSRPADHISETALEGAPWDVTIAAVSGQVEAVEYSALSIAQDVLAGRLESFGGLDL